MAQDEAWGWLSDFQEGDRAGFEKIFSGYKSLVINLAFRFIGNREFAEDVAQEVFIKIYEQKSRLVPRAKFSTWLYRVTVNKALDFQRKKKNRLLSLDESTNSGQSFGDTLIDPSQRPSAALESAELKSFIRKEIQRLPEKLRNVILLHQFEDLSYREIAEILGITEKAVEKRIYHAKEHLRKRIPSDYKPL